MQVLSLFINITAVAATHVLLNTMLAAYAYLPLLERVYSLKNEQLHSSMCPAIEYKRQYSNQDEQYGRKREQDEHRINAKRIRMIKYS